MLAGTVEQLEVSRVGAHPISYGTKARLGARLRTVLTPVEETGLAGARLAARIQYAMHRLPEAELGALLAEIERRARAERLVYLRDDVEDTVRLLRHPDRRPARPARLRAGGHARAPRRPQAPPRAVPDRSGRAGDPGTAVPRGGLAPPLLDAGGE